MLFLTKNVLSLSSIHNDLLFQSNRVKSFYQKEGLVVDVMGFTGGIYPFRCQENSGDLIVTLGGQVFPTQDTIEPDRQHLIQPARRYEYDVWNNKLSETNTLGHTTEFCYNDSNQLIEKKEPLVEKARHKCAHPLRFQSTIYVINSLQNGMPTIIHKVLFSMPPVIVLLRS